MSTQRLGIEIIRAKPLPASELKPEDQYRGLLSPPEVKMKVLVGGKYVEEKRDVKMRLTVRRMISPETHALISKGEEFWATEAEARRFTDGGQAERVAVTLGSLLTETTDSNVEDDAEDEDADEAGEDESDEDGDDAEEAEDPAADSSTPASDAVSTPSQPRQLSKKKGKKKNRR